MNSISISKIIFTAVIFVSFSISSCKTDRSKHSNFSVKTPTNKELFFKLSLAQWSLHRYVEEDKKSPFHFAAQAK